MQWIAFDSLDAASQPVFFYEPGGGCAFCFPGHYPEDFSKQLAAIGFQPSTFGLTAPLTFETADALRSLAGVTHMEKDSAELELPTLRLPPALESMVQQTPETRSLARRAAVSLAQEDWTTFAGKHSEEARTIVDFISSDFHRALVARGWRGARDAAWPLSKNGTIITIEPHAPDTLPVYRLQHAGKTVTATQSLDTPAEIVAQFADQRANLPASNSTNNIKEPEHGTASTESTRLSPLVDAPDLPDGQRTGKSTGIVPDSKRGISVPAPQRRHMD